MQRASSLRKYLFIRETDQAIIARGETKWVFVDAHTRRPRPIPKEVASVFTIVAPDREPELDFA